MDILVKVHTSRMSGALKHLVAGAPAATTIVFGEIQNFFQDTESVTGEGRYKVQEGAYYKVQPVPYRVSKIVWEGGVCIIDSTGNFLKNKVRRSKTGCTLKRRLDLLN